MVKTISNDQTENRKKADQSVDYKMNGEQCNSVYVYFGETRGKFTTQMKEYAQSKAERDNKSLFGKHCNDEEHSSKAKQKCEALHTENATSEK